MRETIAEQASLVIPGASHEHVRELEAMSAVLDGCPEVAELVHEDLTRGLKNPGTGRRGLSGELTLRALVLKQMLDVSYRKLAFTLLDSVAYRAFCKLGIEATSPSRSALQRSIKRVQPGTLERVNWVLLIHAREDGIETGRTVRCDCTVTESNIHSPEDSSLLWDGVRVLVRNMHAVDEYCTTPFRDRTRVSKRRAFAIRNAKTNKVRRKLYRELLTHARATVSAAKARCAWLERNLPDGVDDYCVAVAAVEELRHYIPLVEQVIGQTERRVLRDEKVPPQDKLVSIFEPHTDIIRKDRRDTYYGHKLTFTTGASGLVLDCQVLDGNPADSTLAVELVQRQGDIYGRVPRQVAFDGGFAAKANLTDIKALGVSDVMFNKKRGLAIPDMVKSAWVYKRLSRFRAGIEAGISWLKRVFGLRRCTWRTLDSFKAYAWASVVSANLLILARHSLD